MKIAFLSLSGNVRDFVERVGMESVEINYSNPFASIDEPYIVIAPSYDEEVTEVISQFVEHENNQQHLVGFVGSGNLNFDNSYCFCAVDLSKKFAKPLIMKFELSGTEHDVLKFKEEVEKIGITEINKY